LQDEEVPDEDSGVLETMLDTIDSSAITPATKFTNASNLVAWFLQSYLT